MYVVPTVLNKKVREILNGVNSSLGTPHFLFSRG